MNWFIYVFDIANKDGPTPESDCHNLRMTDDRKLALMWIKVLGLKCKVVIL